MTLYFIGIGLCDEKDITVKGLEAVKKCDYVYLEKYTSILQVPLEKLEHLYGKKIKLADREQVEKRAYEILEDAKNHNVAFLVVGDIFGATTHTDLMLRAKEQKVECIYIHNASIMNAIGIVGLELYKYGKTTSIPFATDSFKPETPYDVIKLNRSNHLHTLILLDLRPDENRFMTVGQGLKYMMEIEHKRKEEVLSEETLAIGCARIGCGNFKIKAGKVSELIHEDFGPALHCIIIPGNMHFIEEEAIAQWKN
ncbi:MAG TPA: diphthine synthase [Alphaproteobacteria bacterium]|nr:diphthine synthase [Alphaproteobacteria bacterium]